MLCPKCGTEIIGASCTNCGYQIEKSSPTNQQFPPDLASQPYQQTQGHPNSLPTQQYTPPIPPLKWFNDGSIWALILAIISVLIFMSIFFNFSSISSICSLVFSFFALKLAIHSKKHQGRIALLSIILTAIIFLGEISFFGFLIYALSRSGF